MAECWSEIFFTRLHRARAGFCGSHQMCLPTGGVGGKKEKLEHIFTTSRLLTPPQNYLKYCLATFQNNIRTLHKVRSAYITPQLMYCKAFADERALPSPFFGASP